MSICVAYNLYTPDVPPRQLGKWSAAKAPGLLVYSALAHIPVRHVSRKGMKQALKLVHAVRQGRYNLVFKLYAFSYTLPEIG